jgi:carbamate kinase
MLAVVAVGGNALTRSNQVGTIPEQFDNALLTCRHLARMVERGTAFVLTHGNGPQVGNVLRRIELSRDQVYPLPLDICDADTQGGIGYMLQQVLGNELRQLRLDKTVVTLVTQVLVDGKDPAFANPDKPIGPFYGKADADKRMSEGWQMREDAGRGYRRVVPSPKPLRIIELEAVRRCVEAGLLPIAAGGGGVPVIERDGELHGVEAVIDKDRASALLASNLGADLFVICTGVTEVQVRYGKSDARALREVSAGELRAHAQAGEFPAGSMGPKIEAALDYLGRGGRRVIITDAEHIGAALEGTAGTQITP